MPLRYTLRTGPAAATAVTVVGAAGLLWLVDRWPWQLWPLVGVTAASLGAAGAILLDEPAAAIVDTLPRPFWWRAVARLPLAALLIGVWLAGIALVDVRPIGRPDVVRLEGIALVLVGLATAAVLRRRGWTTPGTAIGSGIVLVITFAALRNPAHRHLPLFAYGPDDRWSASARLWTIVLVVAALTLAASCLEGRRIRRHG